MVLRTTFYEDSASPVIWQSAAVQLPTLADVRHIDDTGPLGKTLKTLCDELNEITYQRGIVKASNLIINFYGEQIIKFQLSSLFALSEASPRLKKLLENKRFINAWTGLNKSGFEASDGVPFHSLIGGFLLKQYELYCEHDQQASPEAQEFLAAAATYQVYPSPPELPGFGAG